MSTIKQIALELSDFLKGESLFVGKILSTERQAALDLIEKRELGIIANRMRIDSGKFVERLRQLVEFPYLINQGRFGLCAPATFLFVLIKDFPVEFVDFAFTLLERGNSNIGNLKIITSNDFKNSSASDAVLIDRALDRSNTHEADYLLLGALRDSRNVFFDIEFTEVSINDIDIDNISYFFYNLLQNDVKDPDAYSGSNSDLEFWFKETGFYKPLKFVKADPNNPDTILDQACRSNETILIDIESPGDADDFIRVIPGKSVGHVCAIFNEGLMYSSNRKNIFFTAVSWGRLIPVTVSAIHFKEGFRGHMEINRI